MPTVAAVRLRYATHDYWFDPNDAHAQAGDHVIVETSRGTDVGLCTAAELDVDEKDVSCELKPIVRVASDEDMQRIDELSERSAEAIVKFREVIEQRGLDMKPVDVTFMFDGKRATFYFTAEQRVDFRGIVRDLASCYHIRVDMHQVGVRDEARMVGGFGHCGEQLCCVRLGTPAHPVSIRMAKEQDLSLNPTKISGLCGRLMCCLCYEHDAYKEFKSRAPKKGAMIDTPLGLAKVIEFDTPRETVRVRFEDGKQMALPVADLDTGGKVAREGENIRPCHITQEKFDALVEELHHDTKLAMLGGKAFSEDPDLEDKTAVSGALERTPRKKRRPSGQSHAQGTSRRSGAQPAQRDQRKRRRSVSAEKPGSANAKPSDGGRAAAGGSGSKNAGKRRRKKARSAQSQQKSRQDKPRPGQYSSTLSGEPPRGSGQGAQPSGGRRKRRRRHSSGTDKANGRGNTQGGGSPDDTGKGGGHGA